MLAFGRLTRVLVAVIALAAVSLAQVKIGGIAVTTSAGAIENGGANEIDTNVGGVVNFRNDGPVGVIIRFYDDNGALVSEYGLNNPANTNVELPAGFIKGNYKIKIRDASQPLNTEQTCGTLIVH